jgi:DNA invertase Pin-like site-specific DNA recombinase
MAAVTELEAGLISQRTRAALAMTKTRGGVLSNPRLRAGTPDQARAAAAVKQEISCARDADVLP